MVMAAPSRPEVYVAGTVDSTRIIKSREKGEVLGANVAIKAINGDVIRVTAWDRDYPRALRLEHGDAIAVVCYPDGSDLAVSRDLLVSDLEAINGHVSGK